MNVVKTLFVSVAMLAGAAFAGDGVAWRGLDDPHRIGGRKVSEGYLRGKAVLVYCWGCDDKASREMLPRMEEIWKSFKTKPFVLLAAHGAGRGEADAVKAFVEENRFTYPIYEGAGLSEGEPDVQGVPFIYVVDETGKVRYKGKDERLATERLVTLLTDMEAPKNVEMWESFLDYEMKVLPGRAYLRLSEFRKKFPNEARKYDEDYKRLKNDAEVQKLAKLVAFAKMAKDFDPSNKKTKGKVTRSKIGMAIQMYEEPLVRKCKNELIVQEAKNAIADLKWAQTTFSI